MGNSQYVITQGFMSSETWSETACRTPRYSITVPFSKYSFFVWLNTVAIWSALSKVFPFFGQSPYSNVSWFLPPPRPVLCPSNELRRRRGEGGGRWGMSEWKSARVWILMALLGDHPSLTRRQLLTNVCNTDGFCNNGCHTSVEQLLDLHGCERVSSGLFTLHNIPAGTPRAPSLPLSLSLSQVGSSDLGGSHSSRLMRLL